MIKHLITGGCSFSCRPDCDTGWHEQLETYLFRRNAQFTANHTGFGSQGQELIQKKVMLAITEALDNGLQPHEILVVVMWSGTYRKAWYIDNPAIIGDVVNGMPNFQGGMTPIFLDLKNRNAENPAYFKTASGSEFAYNPNGGWLFTVNGSEYRHMDFIQQYYMLDKNYDGVGKVHTSLENIIMLQNFCKLHGVTLINQFFMDFVWEDIYKHRDDLNINYLYKQLDCENMITEGMFETLHQLLNVPRHEVRDITHAERLKLDDNKSYFSRDGFHPGPLGSEYWCNTVLFPFIQGKNIV